MKLPCDAQARIPYFYRQILPLVYAVLQGWSATILVIPPAGADLVQVDGQRWLDPEILDDEPIQNQQTYIKTRGA